MIEDALVCCTSIDESICFFIRDWEHSWICRDKFGTIGKKDTEKLSQIWKLNHRYRIGALRKHKYSILHEGRNNSVVALARGQYDEKELVSPPCLLISFTPSCPAKISLSESEIQ
jgi:hypothetical protein